MNNSTAAELSTVDVFNRLTSTTLDVYWKATYPMLQKFLDSLTKTELQQIYDDSGPPDCNNSLEKKKNMDIEHQCLP